jgi:pimeloyl-ACP methyl ester carboxylesterase
MSTFVLVPGAGGVAWYWHLLVPQLEKLGHEAISVDIREDDPNLGLPEYADIVQAAIGDRRDVVLVGQSLGAFTVPVVANRVPVRMIVLVNAMTPLPGEKPGDWWEATGQAEARIKNDEQAGRSTEFTIETHFLHDVPPDVAASGADEQRGPSDTPFGQPCEFERWPDVPIKVLVGRDDRFFPVDLQRRLAKDRLGIEPDEMPGGHLVALSNPVELAERLDRYDAEVGGAGRLS